MKGQAWFRLRWPHEVKVEEVAAVLSNLHGASTPRRQRTLVLLAVGEGHAIRHYMAVPGPGGVRRQVEAAVGGLAVEPVDEPSIPRVDRCWRGWMSSRVRPLDTTQPLVVSRGVLTALASAGRDELVVMRWTLGPVRRPIDVRRRRRTGDAGVGLPAWALEFARGQALDDAENRVALANKKGVPGWKAALHLGVMAGGRRRQRQLLGQVAGAVRTAQGAGVQVGFRPASRSAMGHVPLARPLLVNVAEMRGLAGWPLGQTDELAGVDRQRSRLVRPSDGVGTAGRVVGQATYPSMEQPLGQTAQDALHHTHVIGPTGVGKTTLLLNLVVQDMEAGRSVVVIEPRGDLVREVLARVPDGRLGDVVVVDPTDERPVGVNPLAARGVPTELKVEQLLAVFKGLWGDSWGPRLEDHLTNGLFTLAATPGMSLAALPMLFTNPAFRAPVVARVADDLVLGPFWDEFNDYTPERRALVLGPVLNKVRPFLVRERLRRIVGQFHPRFDMRDVFRRRTILLANLAVGEIGAESSTLLGSLLFSQLWQAALGRSVVPVARRHPVMVVVDEFQRYLHFADLAEMLAEARGLGVGLTLAHQHLAQLTPSLRAAVLANARSRVVFGTNHEDAAVLVRHSGRLTPVDVMELGAWQIYVTLMSAGATTPWASGRTLPPPDPLRPAQEAQERSRRQWGIRAAVVDAEIERLVTSAPDPPKAANGEHPTIGVIALNGTPEGEDDREDEA